LVPYLARGAAKAKASPGGAIELFWTAMDLPGTAIELLEAAMDLF
jgi:hypothetical protein